MFLLAFVYLGLCLTSIAISRKMETMLSSFVEKNTVINNENALDEYKFVVRKCMYFTLAQIGIIVAALCVCGGFIWMKGFSGAFSLSLLGFALGCGKEVATLEEKARQISCTNKDLEEQYQRISQAWAKEKIPNF